MFHKLKRAIRRWLYRDSDTGRFISKADFDSRDKRTTEREAIMRNEGDSL